MLWGIAFAGLALASCFIAFGLTSRDVSGIQIALLAWISVPYIAAGLVAWWRRPESRLGLLMIAGGFVSGLSALQFAERDLPFTVGALFDVLPAAFFHDNFLQPQPGTSAGDHLAGGLIQTAIFVVLVWAYPRLRPGLRGTLAMAVGLFIIVMGAGEAGHYTRENGPSGDDYTGLLAIPAGVLLVGIGLFTLWRSRKGGGLIRRYARRAALMFAFLVGLAFGVYPLYRISHEPS